MFVGRDADTRIANRQKENSAFPDRGRTGYKFDGGRDQDSALIGEFDGVADQVGQYLTNLDAVPSHDMGDGSINGGGDFDLFGVGASGEEFDNALDQRAQRDFAAFEHQRPRFDFRKVEDVFDERKQRQARLADGFGIGFLVGCERGFQEQPCHTEHTVHRGADLVTHGGEEIGFGAIGTFGLVARIGECGFQALAFGNIATNALDFDQTLVARADGVVFPCNPAIARHRPHLLIVGNTLGPGFAARQAAECDRR